MNTDRTQVTGNYITLGIPDTLKVKTALDPVNTYINERLQQLGASLIKMKTFMNLYLPYQRFILAWEISLYWTKNKFMPRNYLVLNT